VNVCDEAWRRVFRIEVYDPFYDRYESARLDGADHEQAMDIAMAGGER